MIYNLLIAAILIVAFFMCIKAYTLGLKHGKQLSNNQIPMINTNPVKTVIQAVETKKAKEEAEKLEEEIADIMGATRESMLQAIKKEVR